MLYCYFILIIAFPLTAQIVFQDNDLIPLSFKDSPVSSNYEYGKIKHLSTLKDLLADQPNQLDTDIPLDISQKTFDDVLKITSNASQNVQNMQNLVKKQSDEGLSNLFISMEYL